MQTDSNFTGQFLIAMPGLIGDPFQRSVCYLSQYDDQGALGLIINRPADMLLGDILLQTKMVAATDEIASTPVYIGGPVNPERCLVMHRPIGDWTATLQVTEQIGVTGSADVLEAIAAGEGPDQFFICLGYSGWGPGQLDDEMLRNDWLTAPADDMVMFQTAVGSRWQVALGLIGIDPNQLSSDVGHA